MRRITVYHESLFSSSKALNSASTQLKMQSLQSDSAMTVIRRELLRNDREREQKKLERSLQRMEELVVRAPADG